MQITSSIASVSPQSESVRSPDGHCGVRTRACAVCGDTPAKVHYGVLACFGCKGFFRRAVKDGRNKYQCRYERTCPVNKYERNSCRYCRFRKCLQAGMNPDAVRPDRGDGGNDSSTGKSLPIPKMKLKGSLSKKKSLGRTQSLSDPDDWTKLLGQEHRDLLLSLMSLSKKVSHTEHLSFDNVSDFSLKSLIADRTLYTNSFNSSIPSTSSNDPSFTSIWRVVAVVDWIDGLVKVFETGRGKMAITVEDKACLIQSSFAPLTLLTLMAHVAAQPSLNDLNSVRTLVENVKLHCPVKDLVRRLSAELVSPLRYVNVSDADFILLRAIIALNPDCPGLCSSAVFRLREIRSTLFDVLIKSIKRSRPKTAISPSALFGSLLSLIPPLKHVAGDIYIHLGKTFSRPITMTSNPYVKILTDLFSPESNDLVLDAVMDGGMNNGNNREEIPQVVSFGSPVQSPSMSNIIVNTTMESKASSGRLSAFSQLSPCSSSTNIMSPPYAGAIRPMSGTPYATFAQPSLPSSSMNSYTPIFQMPSSIPSSSSFFNNTQTTPRPTTLTFSAKLPLQLTKSIEEMLRPNGMAEDPSIINRPLSSDWAECSGMSTPVFNRDVVAQFFPEMAGQIT